MYFPCGQRRIRHTFQTFATVCIAITISKKELGVNVDTVKQKRKFELRAEYTYSDGTSDSVSAVYDWLNTGWQFVALPIEIKKENGNTLPTEFPFGFDEESKMLVGLQLIVDYSYNTGDFEYDCCSLRKGNWTRTDYYEDGKQKSVQDSRSKSKTVYYYDDNDKLIAEELTDYKTELTLPSTNITSREVLSALLLSTERSKKRYSTKKDVKSKKSCTTCPILQANCIPKANATTRA